MSTVRVRVKVLLNAEGKWAAYGYPAATDNDYDEVLYDMLSSADVDSARSFYLVADLELPQPTEVAAEVQSEGA